MIAYGAFYNGIGKSKADQNAFDDMVNVDPHTEIGYLIPQYALTLESSTPLSSIQAVAPSGTEYFFSTTGGSIWKRTTGGTYSSVTSNSNTTGHKGATYFNGYIWYWTSTKLGFFIPDTEGSKNDSFATFTNSSALGCCEVNGALHIADGRYIASVDSANVFSANVLDFPSGTIATIMIGVGTDLLIGTYKGSNVHECKFYLWDTYSPSWSIEDTIPETSPNCFIDADNVKIAQCGANGALYYWNGGQMIPFDNAIRGVTTSIAPFNSCTYNKRPTFAVGSKVFTIFKQFASSSFAIVQEYTATGTVTSVMSTGGQLLVAHSGGVDKISTSRATGYVITPDVSTFMANMVEVDIDIYGEGVGVSTNSNDGGWVTQIPIYDSPRKKVYFDGGLPDSTSTQAKVTLTPNGSDYPKIKAITLR